MLAYWSTLGRREKQLIILAVIIGLFFLIYILWLEPGYKRLNTLREQVPVKHAELEEIRSRLQRLQPALAEGGQQVEANSTASLLTQIEKSANLSGLRRSINRIQPQRDGQIRVWLNDIYFDPWLLWVESMRQQKIIVTEASISRTSDEKVNIRATLHK